MFGIASEFISKNRSVFIDCFILLFVSLIPFWYTGITGIWNKTDLDFPLYPIENFLKNFTLWNESFSVGYASSILNQAMLSRYFLWAALASVGLSSFIVERVYFVLIELLLGFGMYYLISTIFPYKNQAVKRLACMTSAIFYMINPYMIFRLYFGQDGYSLTLAILPFMLVFVYKGLKTGAFKYSVLAALSSIVLLSCNSSVTLLYIALFGAYILLHIFSDFYKSQRADVIKHLKFTIITVFAVILVNLWWIIPLLYSYFFTNALDLGFLPTGFELVQNWANQYAHSGLLYVMRLELFLTQPVYTSASFSLWINSPLFILTGLLLACVVPLSILLKPNDKHVIFFTITTIISLGLISLVYPFEQIYQWLWDNFFIMRRFYVPDRFMNIAVPGYAVLLGVSVAEIYKRYLGKKTKKGSLFSFSKFLRFSQYIFSKVFALAFVCLILINSYPMLDGNLGGILKPANIPSYYTDARNWLQQQSGNFRVMLIPKYDWLERYTWGPDYDMVGITKNVFAEPVIQGSAGGGPAPQYSQEYISYVYTSIENNSTTNLGELLNSLNARYLCVRDDLLPVGTSTQPMNTTWIKSVLQNQKDMHLAGTFGSLSFYENDAYEDSYIYGFSSIITTINSFDNTSNIQTCNIERFNVDQDSTDSSASVLAITNASASNLAETEGWSQLQYNSQSSWNLSKIDQIRFWFKIDSMAFRALEFSIYDLNDDCKIWRFTDLVTTVNEWHQIALPFESGLWGMSTSFDSSSARYVRLRILMPLSNVGNLTFKIDNLAVVSTDRFDGALTYRSDNSGKHYVELDTNATFTLVFSQSYDAGWTAKISGKNAELEHFVVTSYANGWYINETGRFTIILEYRPQTYFYYSVGVSAISVVLLSTVAFIIEIRRYLRRKKREFKT